MKRYGKGNGISSVARGKRGRFVLNIKNFAPIEKARFEFIVPGINVITGDNGTGKTRAILALYFLNELLKLSNLNKHSMILEVKHFMIPRHFPWVENERGTDLSKLFLDIEKPVELELEAYERDHERPFARVKVVLSYKDRVYKERKKDHEIDIDVKTERRGGKHRIPIHVIGPFRTTFTACSCPFKFPQAYVDSFAEFRERVTCETRLTAFSDKPKVHFYPNGTFEFEVNGKRLRPPEAASGWTELAYFYAYMEVAKQPPRLIAIEEPEAHLFPQNVVALMRDLMKYVRRGYGFLITTHSPLLSVALSLLMEEENVHGLFLRWYILERGGKGSILKECNVHECLANDVLLNTIIDLMKKYVVMNVGRD